MSAIAERAGAPIGSLYQFFPNKQAVTHALRTQYGKYYEAQLIALQADAKNLSLDRLVGRLVTLSLDFIETHPAFLPLLEAPPSTRSPLSLRRTLRRRLSQCLAGVTPSVNRPKALRCATVTLEMLKGLSHLYGEVPAPKRRQVVSEYRIALSSYLGARLGAGHTR